MSKRLNMALKRLTADPRAPFWAVYPCKVLKDHGDMRLDLEPDNPKLPKLVRVPIRTFLPGVTALKVRVGSRVLLGFEGADPTKPVCYLWQSGAVQELELVSDYGLKVQLSDSGERILLQTPEGRKIELDDTANQTLVSDPVKVRVAAPLVEVDGSSQVKLAGGGPALARVGDQIQVTGVQPGLGSANGTIISGSSKANSG